MLNFSKGYLRFMVAPYTDLWKPVVTTGTGWQSSCVASGSDRDSLTGVKFVFLAFSGLKFLLFWYFFGKNFSNFFQCAIFIV